MVVSVYFLYNTNESGFSLNLANGILLKFQNIGKHILLQYEGTSNDENTNESILKRRKMGEIRE